MALSSYSFLEEFGEVVDGLQDANGHLESLFPQEFVEWMTYFGSRVTVLAQCPRKKNALHIGMSEISLRK